MGLYKINSENVAQRVKNDTLDYESSFEDWLENTPSLLFDDDSSETLLWIGRQATATVGGGAKHPDLIGIDADGDLVIVELKRGKTPRDIIAQILEYASWGHDLDYENLNNMYLKYAEESTNSLLETFMALFELETNIKEDYFNKKQKLFIVAEKIDPIVNQVSNYLCEVYKMNINHLEYEVMKTEQQELIISVKKSFGYVRAVIPQEGSADKWSGEKLVDLVHDAVISLVGQSGKTFAIRDVDKMLVAKFPTINTSSVNCRIMQDCVNHGSRRHWPSGQKDYYYLIEKGKYRLYDSSTDGKWNWEGRKI